MKAAGSRTSLISSVIIFAAAGLFTLKFGSKYGGKPGLPDLNFACRVYDFDHVTYLRLLRESRWSAQEHLATVSGTDGLNVALGLYLESKIESLDRAAALVTAQVSAKGSRYGCDDEGAEMFLRTLDYPTFEALDYDAQTKWLREEVKKAREFSWTDAVTIAGGIAGIFFGLGGLAIALDKHLLERRKYGSLAAADEPEPKPEDPAAPPAEVPPKS